MHNEAGGIPLVPVTIQGSQGSASYLLSPCCPARLGDKMNGMLGGRMGVCACEKPAFLWTPGRAGLAERMEGPEKLCHLPLNLVVQPNPVLGGMWS